MATGFPALMIRPPESPLQQFGQIQQIRGAQQEQQMNALKIQQEQQALKDRNALTQAMTQWDGQDYKALPMLVLKNGGSGPAAMQMSSQVLDMRSKASELAKNDALTAQTQTDNAIKLNDEYRGRILNITGIKDPIEQQAAWDKEVTAEESSGKIQPGQIPHQYIGNDKATAFANSFALGSKLVEEAKDRQTLAQSAWKSAGGALVNTVTGEKIGGIPDIAPINQGLKTRWQVLNPGKEVPDYFQLKAGATPADFDRIDKLLDSSERATATKAQQDTVNAIRQQTFQLATDKEGYNWVTGTATQGPSAGKVVAVPQADIKKYGIQDAGKMESADITKTQSGRQWLTLANKQAPANATPDEMGISQLLDKLDKEDKLGPLAGRLNEFLAGKYGSGDPEYSALRTKLDLSNTLLATVHSGRLGPFLMENMQGLAAAGKMDGPTLKAAFKSEQDYVGDRAMDPNPPDYSQQGAKKATAATFQVPTGAPQAPKEDGHTLRMNGKDIAVSKGGQWVSPTAQ